MSSAVSGPAGLVGFLVLEGEDTQVVPRWALTRVEGWLTLTRESDRRPHERVTEHASVQEHGVLNTTTPSGLMVSNSGEARQPRSSNSKSQGHHQA